MAHQRTDVMHPRLFISASASTYSIATHRDMYCRAVSSHLGKAIGGGHELEADARSFPGRQRLRGGCQEAVEGSSLNVRSFSWRPLRAALRPVARPERSLRHIPAQEHLPQLSHQTCCTSVAAVAQFLPHLHALSACGALTLICVLLCDLPLTIAAGCSTLV